MNKLILTGIILLSTLGVMAQVGIGTADPQATLDVVADNTDAAKADAVLVPRFTVAELAAKDDAFLVAQNGSLVFITAGSGTAGKTIDIDGVGFYYFDATTSDRWVAVGGGGAVAQARSIRVATDNVLTNSDLNGFIIDNAGRSYDIEGLTDQVDGDTITFLQQGPNTTNVSNVTTNSTKSTQQIGSGLSFVYDAETDAWYSFNVF